MNCSREGARFQGCAHMSKQTKKALTPRLRFPEFRDAGEWDVNKIEKACEKPFSGGTPTSTTKEYYGGTIPFIRSAEIDKEKTELFLTDEGLKNSSAKFVKKGDVLIALYGANSGDVAIGQIDGAINQAILCLRSKSSNAFLYQCLSFRKQEIISKYLQGGQGNLSGDIIKSIELLFPKPEEQQKIADCLASLDELLTLEAQKLDTLKTHKKGLMQQFFPAEGETLPKLRFLEFRDAGEWVETTIGEIGSFYYGKSAPKWSLEEGAPTQCVRYGELYTKFGAVITETFSRTNIDPSNLRFSKGGEILVPRVGEKPEDFGKCCCYLPLGDIAIGEMISVFETAQNPLFYTYYFRNLHRQFAKVVEGQNVKNLYYTELEPLAICRPSFAEQQKIADCLASLDDLITAQTQKLTALKTHKKGLMQQLFPALEEEQV